MVFLRRQPQLQGIISFQAEWFGQFSEWLVIRTVKTI
jgi:hypothetical protein